MKDLGQAPPPLRDLPDWKPGLRSQVRIGGRYLLLDEVGRGTTAVVYKARDTWSDALVALKVLKGSAAGHPRLAAGFRREAEIGKQTHHPNVITVYGSGEHDGWIYLAMEYLNGRTLAEMFALSPKMPLTEFEPLCRQLLAALACVHAAGIVHRDVKPSNLMQAPAGEWKLMDFGISRFQEDAPTVGPALGTPNYMSPEQLLADPATAASDIYAAGVVFYEALTGQLPFRDPGMVERCTNVAPRVSAIRPSIPEWLDQMIAGCLAVNPKDRFASAPEVLAQLGAFEEVPAETPVEPPPWAALLAKSEAPPPAPELPILRDYLTDTPGRTNDVLAIFLEILRNMQQRAMRGEECDPLTPASVHRSPSGRIEIQGHSSSVKRDTIMVENPKYAAPEILRGHAQLGAESVIKSDLYALGFMLYEFLAGRTAFRKEFPAMDEAGSGFAWMEWHSDPAKKAHPIAEVVPDIPPTISDLVASMMEKDAAKRCSTHEEAIGKIQSVIHRTQVTQQLNLKDLNLENLPVANASGAKRTPKPARKRWPAMVAVVFVLVLAGLGLLFLVLRRG